MISIKPKPDQNMKKAIYKIGLIVMVGALILVGLSSFFSDADINEFKYNLTLWNIIILVIIINVVSFICFLIFYVAYYWVKQDLSKSKSKSRSKSKKKR